MTETAERIELSDHGCSWAVSQIFPWSYSFYAERAPVWRRFPDWPVDVIEADEKLIAGAAEVSGRSLGIEPGQPDPLVLLDLTAWKYKLDREQPRTPLSYTCVGCGKEFSGKNRRPVPRCEACQDERKRERWREHQRSVEERELAGKAKSSPLPAKRLVYVLFTVTGLEGETVGIFDTPQGAYERLVDLAGVDRGRLFQKHGYGDGRVTRIYSEDASGRESGSWYLKQAEEDARLPAV